MRAFSFFVSVLIAACGSSPVPESALVRIDEAAHLFEKGRLDDAEASFRLAIELHPHVPAAHAGLGLVALARGHLEEAEVHLRAAVEIDVRPALGTPVRLGNMRGKVVRHFQEGVAIEFANVLSREGLQMLM